MLRITRLRGFKVSKFRGWGACVALALALLPALTAGGSAEAVKRLILTDGNYQTVTEWKQEGGRVKYFSAERAEWEELPASLVDWKATGEWNAAAAKSETEELKQVTGEEVAARKEEMLNNPQVAPAQAPELRLPPDGGVFLLEEKAGKPVLLKVTGSRVWENDHEASTRLKRSLIPVPIVSQLQTMELKGPTAKVRLHSAAPAIFVDVENERGPIAGDGFRIVRLEAKSGLRVLAKKKIGAGGGQSVKEDYLLSRAEKFSGDWWKVIPLEKLTPGEYAVVAVAETGEDEALVWDFGVER